MRAWHTTWSLAGLVFATITFLLALAIVLEFASRASAEQSNDQLAVKAVYYQGPWVTTNRKLNGTINCEVKQLSPDAWQGRFWGVWQHVPMDYTVQFGRDSPTAAKNGGRLVSITETQSADAMPVAGKATIDGAHYDWVGTFSPEEFDIQFTSSRYQGHLELKRSADPIPTPVQQ
jgi:hypothetical protein